METERILDLLAKCLELADSDIDGEALSAARKANNLRQKLGKSWEDIISTKSETAKPTQEADPKPFSVHTELSRLHMRVAELQTELDHSQAQKNLLEEEKQLLRASLEEAHSDNKRRESDLRDQMSHFIDQLTLEQDRVRNISENLSLLQIEKQQAETQKTDLDKRLHHLACRNQALKDVIQEMTDREVLLRSRIKSLDPDDLDDLDEADFSYEFTLETKDFPATALADTPESDDLSQPSLPAPKVKLNRLLPALPLPAKKDADAPTYIIEVKPLSRLVTDATLKHATEAFSSARATGAEYIMSSPSGITLGHLFDMDIDPAIAASIVTAIDASQTLTWSDYVPIRDRFNLKMVQVAAVVLQYNLRFIRQPWQLKRLPDGQNHDNLRGIL